MKSTDGWSLDPVYVVPSTVTLGKSLNLSKPGFLMAVGPVSYGYDGN